MELSLEERARSALQTYFKYPDFRPGQWEIISSALTGHNTLAVLPTGGGKSICYQIPALLSHGLTIVVSPLISLMKDQVDTLLGLGIRATAIHSFIEFPEALQRLDDAREGRYSILYVAPERFESYTFLERIKQAHITLFAVDEAHCISEWGHNFRPSYRRLKEAIRFLGMPPVLALTATATPDVRRDIVSQLELEKPNVIVRGFDRPNLSFQVMRDIKKRTFILETCLKGEPGIVYAGTRKTVEDLAQFLKMEGVSAMPYHAGLADRDRHIAQERFLAGEVQVMVATTAFGMGIDKPDVRFVIHHDMPSTIEQYYQEAGRAGRDGKPSRCVLLHAPSDSSLPEFFIQSSFPSRTLVQEVYAHLHDLAGTKEGQEYRGLLNVTASSIGAQLAVQNTSAIQAALRLLEENEYIRIVHASYAESDLMFTVSPDRMRMWLAEAAPESLQPVAVALLRTVGGEAFHHPVRFLLSEIADKSFLPEDFLLDGLRMLQSLGLLRYTMGQRSSGVALTHQRVASKNLVIDYRKLDALKRHQMEKLQAVQQYIDAGTCRRNIILGYFEEQFESTCGMCDNCTVPTIALESAPESELRQRLILECVAELGGKFGKSTIIDVLRGASTKRISQFRLYEANTYGAAGRVPKQELASCIDGLLGMGWIAKTDSIHPTVHVTETGSSKLRRTVTPLNLPRFSSGGEEAIRDQELYNTLRNVRRRIATTLNIPSHTLMNDTVLRTVANTAPETDSEFERLEGVGPVTVQRCGREMLKAIVEHKEQQLAAEVKRAKPVQAAAIPPSLQGTFRLCSQGLNLTEIAEELHLTEGTISGHIAELLSLGFALNTTHLIPAAHREQITGAIARLHTKELRKIRQVVDGEITYAEIRVVLGEMDRRQSR